MIYRLKVILNDVIMATLMFLASIINILLCFIMLPLYVITGYTLYQTVKKIDLELDRILFGK